MANFANICMEAQRYDEASQWLGRALKVARSTFGETHPFTVNIQFAQAEVLRKAGRKVEAKAAARTASEAQKAMLPQIADFTVDYRDLRKSR